MVGGYRILSCRVDQSLRRPLVGFHHVPLPDQSSQCDMKGRYARFSALALRASDIGIGSGMTSIISSVHNLRAEWRRIDRLREKIKHLMVQAPQSIRMIHFRFFIIAFLVWVVRGCGVGTYLSRIRIPPNELLHWLTHQLFSYHRQRKLTHILICDQFAFI